MRKEAFNFSMVPNIPANAEFHFYYDDKITCKRIGKTEKVRYNYGEHSFSSAFAGILGTMLKLKASFLILFVLLFL